MTEKQIYFIFLLIVLFCSFCIAQNSLAWSFSDISGFTSTTAGEAGLSQTETAPMVAKIITAILGIVGALFVILFIYGGFIWLTSAGSDEKIGKAKKILSYAVIGVVIVAAAYTISTFIANAIFTGTAPTEGTGTGTTGANDCTSAGGVCATYDYCTRDLQGTSLGVKTQCPDQVCCQQPTQTVDCRQCGKTPSCILGVCSPILNVCGQSECEDISCFCHFRIPNLCDYDPPPYMNGGPKCPQNL